MWKERNKMRKSSSIAQSFSILTAISLSEKVIAFIFEAIIAYKLGTSIITDAYFSASEFFSLIDSTFLGSLTVVAMNRFLYHQNQEGEEKSFSILSNILSCYLPIIIIISACIFCFAQKVSYIVAPGYDSAARSILVRCIKAMSVIPTIACVTSIGLAILRQKKRFEITALKSFFISVVGIASLLAFGKRDAKNSDVLVFAYILSILLYCILTSFSAGKYGKLRFILPRFDSEIKATVRMLLPLMMSCGVGHIALMLGKMIASLLGEGHVSSLTYAHTLYRVVYTIFIANLSVILLTDFNELMAQKNFNAMKQKICSVVSIMTLFLIPITIVSVVCSKDIVKIIYERGSFSPTSTAAVASVLIFYALNFIPAMVHSIYNQVLYANGDTKTPMWIALASIAVNFVSSLILVRVIGLPGVAIGTLISSLVSTFLCKIYVKKILVSFKGCYSIRFVLRSLIASGLCALVALLVQSFELPALLTFLITTILAMGAFIGFMLLMRDEITITAAKWIAPKIKKMLIHFK